MGGGTGSTSSPYCKSVALDYMLVSYFFVVRQDGSKMLSLLYADPSVVTVKNCLQISLDCILEQEIFLMSLLAIGRIGKGTGSLC